MQFIVTGVGRISISALSRKVLIITLLIGELWTAGSFLGREGRFSLWVWLLVSGPCSNGRPHTQDHMGSVNWS